MDKAPPLRLLVDSQATLTAIISPAKIPIHWQQPVLEGLERDVALGVIIKVPVNTPVKHSSLLALNILCMLLSLRYLAPMKIYYELREKGMPAVWQ